MRYLNNFPQKLSYLFELMRGNINSFYYNLVYKKAKIGKKLRVGKNSSFALWGDYGLHIADNVYFRNFCRTQIESGKLQIGSNTFFNNFCTINCLKEIIIGDNCLFGESVKIYDHNHAYYDSGKLISQQGYSFGEIKIGNNCWIGSNVVVLKGVTIGDNVVVGANAVVFEDIPSNYIVKSQPPKASKYHQALDATP